MVQLPAATRTSRGQSRQYLGGTTPTVVAGGLEGFESDWCIPQAPAAIARAQRAATAQYRSTGGGANGGRGRSSGACRRRARGAARLLACMRTGGGANGDRSTNARSRDVILCCTAVAAAKASSAGIAALVVTPTTYLIYSAAGSSSEGIRPVSRCALPCTHGIRRVERMPAQYDRRGHTTGDSEYYCSGRVPGAS